MLKVDENLPTIELYGVGASTGVWDFPTSKWDDPLTKWDNPATASAWRSVACQVTAFKSTWGADEQTGVLAQSAAGVLTLQTYDPDRLLDPSNLSSPLAKARTIGNPCRLMLGALVLGYGYVDEIGYTFSSRTGSLTAADDIATLAQAETTQTFWQPSNSLIAFATAAIASAGQSVPVGAAPAAGDPVISYNDTRAKSVWALIKDAAMDALCYAWIDRQTNPPTLRFAPFSASVNRGLRLGDGGIPMGELLAAGSAAGVANVVDDATGELARISSVTGRDQQVEVNRIEPAGANWGNAILADRAKATIALIPGEIYPQSIADLTALVQAQAMDLVRIVLVSQGVDVSLRVTGMTVEGEAGGVYRNIIFAYNPGAPWSYLPPPPASVAATPSMRTITETKGATIWFGGSIQPGAIRTHGWGLGPNATSSTGAGPYQWASLLAFDPIDWTGIRRVRKMELELVWDRVGPSGALVDVQRIADTWDEGRVPSGGTGADQAKNSVVWPGPAVDSDRVQVTLTPTAAGGTQRIDVTSILWNMLPINLGGRGYPSFGLRVKLAPEAPTTPGAIYLASRETDDDEATGTGCRLILTVEV